jgi:hypothetical protein
LNDKLKQLILKHITSRPHRERWVSFSFSFGSIRSRSRNPTQTADRRLPTADFEILRNRCLNPASSFTNDVTAPRMELAGLDLPLQSALEIFPIRAAPHLM